MTSRPTGTPDSRAGRASHPDLRDSAVSKKRPLEHIGCREGDVGGYVLLPGDPARVPSIAHQLDEAREIAHHREFRTYTGSLDGVPVSVTSTGIGGPSAAIAVDELAHLGAHTFIRVGTCGALQPDVHVGDIIIATGAIRDEGASQQFAPLAYPATSSHDVVAALRQAAIRLAYSHHLGTVHTTDSYWTQHEPGRFPTEMDLMTRYESWLRLGALASEMETAPILVIGGGALGLRVGSVLAVAGNRRAGEHLNNPATAQRRDRALESAITTAVEATRLLIHTAGPAGRSHPTVQPPQ